MNGTYEQRAEGKAILPVSGNTHCGITSGELHLEYSIRLTYRSGALDESGFLLDNLTFANYWQERADAGVGTLSCEELAESVCVDLVGMLQNEGRAHYLSSVCCSISPFAGVSVMYRSSGPFTHRPYRIAPEPSHDFIPANVGEAYGYV